MSLCARRRWRSVMSAAKRSASSADIHDGTVTVSTAPTISAVTVRVRRRLLTISTCRSGDFGRYADEPLWRLTASKPGRGTSLVPSTEGMARRYRAYAAPVAIVRLFASAREAAGTGRDVIEGATVADVLSAARSRYGPTFAAVLSTAKVWVNGEPVPESTTVGPRDEVAVLPPVSGGADGYDPAPMDLPLFERVTADGYLGDVKVRSLDDIRSLRRECQRVEANLSYLRRLAQGRIDMVADAARVRLRASRSTISAMSSPTFQSRSGSTSSARRGGGSPRASDRARSDDHRQTRRGLRQRHDRVVAVAVDRRTRRAARSSRGIRTRGFRPAQAGL